ncbi:MAG: hypothetical protein MJK04_12570, partial [Psychrosphaera sp.]|nr:hypothetical protein [Psychrosphaera sp.]
SSIPANALFIDAFDLTLDITTDEMTDFENQLSKVNPEFSVNKKHVSAAKAVKFRSQWLVTELAGGASFLIFTQPFNKTQNKAKLSFNPSKQLYQGLFHVLKLLKKACGERYQQVILNANVTRIDMTFDVIGVPVNQLKVRLSNSKQTTIFTDKNGEFETYKDGAKGLFVKAYNLTNSRLTKAMTATNSSGINTLKALPVITRVEVTYCPQKTGGNGNCKLGKLCAAFKPFANVHFYNPALIRHELDESDFEIYQKLGISGLLRYQVTLGTANYNRVNRRLKKARIKGSPSLDMAPSQRLDMLLEVMLCPSKRKFLRLSKKLTCISTNMPAIKVNDYA